MLQICLLHGVQGIKRLQSNKFNTSTTKILHSQLLYDENFKMSIQMSKYEYSVTWYILVLLLWRDIMLIDHYWDLQKRVLIYTAGKSL